jgi:hypothetical protein
MKKLDCQKIVKLIVVSSSAVFAGLSMGAEVTATNKKAAIMTPIENMYGRIELRQTSMRWKNTDGKIDNGVSSYRLVPRLGTKAFNDRLDVYVEVPITNEARTSMYSQSPSTYQATFAALSGEVFSVTPYVQGYLPHNGSDFTSDAAVNLTAAKSVDLALGTLDLRLGFEPHVASGTQPTRSDVGIRRNGSLSLDQAGKPETKTIDNREPTTMVEYLVGFTLTPKATPKLSLSVDTFIDREFAPVYEVRDTNGSESVEKTGYKIGDATTTDFVLNYAADKLTSVQSLTRVRNDGWYAAGVSSSDGARMPQVEQRISLIHKLF